MTDKSIDRAESFGGYQIRSKCQRKSTKTDIACIYFELSGSFLYGSHDS